MLKKLMRCQNIFSHPALTLVLTKLFNIMLDNGVLPDNCCENYTCSIPNTDNTGGKELNVSDFRGISICPVISKVFENCLIRRFVPFLLSCDHQMRFKKGMSCSHAIYSFRKVVDHYTVNSSAVNVYVLLNCLKHLTKLTILHCW